MQTPRSGSALALLLALSAASCDNPDAIQNFIDKIGQGGGGGGAKTCGGPGGKTCGPEFFCDQPAGTCGKSEGVCRPRPTICTAIANPVCGCDGKTYGNDCTRQAAGVSKLSDGACSSGGLGEGEVCGGFAPTPQRQCKPGLFCMQQAGMCRVADASGICEVTPTGCRRDLAPVCGCDGKTYGNDCERQRAKVPLDRKGACEKPPGGQEGAMCGGIAGFPCDKGLFCEPPANMCKVADVAGVCRKIPDSCGDIFSPVCGCDGKTYGNDCDRQRAGAAKLSDGACGSPVEVGEGEQCGGHTLPPARVCKRGLFCMQKPGTCGTADVPGVCETTPTACTKEFVPVCGCDGKTYGNDCLRRAARVPLDHAGACEKPPGGQEGAMCGGFPGIPCAKGLFCELPANSCNVADVPGVCRKIPDVCADIFAPVCGCNGKTYGNDCERQAAGAPKRSDGACDSSGEVGEGEQCGGFTPPPLRVCKAGLFCMQLPNTCGGADVPGICEVTPTGCSKEAAPVCGCDGKTYGNDCTRRAARVPLDHKGACGRPGGQEGAMCGGIAGFPCAMGLFCEPAANTCHIADVAGVCKKSPQACDAIFAPVCGCDGKTYGNDCERQLAAAPKAHDGACP